MDREVPYLEKRLIMRLLFVFLLSLILVPGLQASSFDHSPWDRLLTENVLVTEDGNSSSVNYDGMLEKRKELHVYLNGLADVPKETFDGWTRDGQLAFLINVYNSWTVELILEKYPDVKSIKDLGSLFSSPWKKKIVQLFGEKYSLDDIEHGFIRDSDTYKDPRIHFAVNCASIGCPALRTEAYRENELQYQLADATELFLRDQSRNRFRDGRLEVSAIFKWYRQDFEKGWLDYTSLEQFLAHHAEALGLSPSVKEALLAESIEITFLSYDWMLNRTP
jgi:hypothetical protein